MQKEDGFLGQKYFELHISNNMVIDTSLLDNCTVTEIGYYPNAKYHFKERLSGIGENILIYCTDGSGSIEINHSEKVFLTCGEVFCIPAHTPHCYYSHDDDPWSIAWVHFKYPLLSKIIKSYQKKIIISSDIKRKIIDEHFSNLLLLSEQGHNNNNLICIFHLFISILTEIYLLDDMTTIDEKNVFLQQIISYLNAHLKKNISLSMLAGHFNISPSYLNKIFKEYTSKSPIDYFISLKMEKACKLLKLTDLKTYEISAQVGYQDPYYFSRIFKKTIGVSPKKYRLHTLNGAHSF